MKKLIVVMLTLTSLAASAKSVTCTVEGGKNLRYLPTTVMLDTEVKTSTSGPSYIFYKGLTLDGQPYSGGKAYLQDLSPQIVSQVKVLNHSQVLIEESDELRKDIYNFDLVNNRLQVKIKTSKIFTMAKAVYNCH